MNIFPRVILVISLLHDYFYRFRILTRCQYTLVFLYSEATLFMAVYGSLSSKKPLNLLETLLIKQEESAVTMQERAHAMFEWENRKKQHIHHKKLVSIQQQERDRLEKQQKQEISYMKFKEWLKHSLIKQREDFVQQRIEKHQKKMKEDEDKRTKAHRRVLAKIAYKDWK